MSSRDVTPVIVPGLRVSRILYQRSLRGNTARVRAPCDLSAHEMARVFIVKSVRYRPWVGTALLFLLTLPFCPWMWKDWTDSYFPYSGMVVEKGVDHHYFAEGTDAYIVVEDSHGIRTKKYVSQYTSAFIEVGSFVMKKKGFRALPLRPGQIDPRTLSLPAK